MSPLEPTEDPEPSEPGPAGLRHVLCVPVRSGTTGCAARFFRTPLGERTAVGFTSEARLAATLGAGHPWIRLAEPALRALAVPLGVTTVTVDPQLSAPAATGTARDPRCDRDPRHAGAARPRTAARQSGPTASAPSAPPALSALSGVPALNPLNG
ncbi:SAV_915 family protein [Streptomyces sp. RK9]|uniref:SAV_915 family protein n=1 Tax=Streptomyces sp. RK9 TaxID=3239284 RepID=UPI0038685F19